MGTSESAESPSGFRAVGGGDGAAVAVAVSEGGIFGICDEPTTHKLPWGSNVAAVAISFEPLSSGSDHWTFPKESRACT